MKIVKAEDVQEQTPQVDQKKIAELQEKFDRERQLIETKQYGVALNEEQTAFLFDEFYEFVDWKGYESYAISETHNQLTQLRQEGSTLNGKIPTEIVEAVFHFLKNYSGQGVESAGLFKQICDQFALPMKEVNEDRQHLRDISLELVAAEQGIEVETLVERLNQQQGYPGQQ